MVNLRWLLQYTSGWIGWGTLEHPVVCPETWRTQCLPKGIPEDPCDHPMDATQAQRDHKIIHARNFRVQPQAIMGSSIVEYVA